MALNINDKFPILKNGNDYYVRGELEFIVKDKHGRIVNRIVEPNLIKIFAKEIIAHRIAPSQIWDPDASTGSGAYIASNVDPDEDFSVKYIVFGASYDDSGVPLDTNDTRYYTRDPITNTYIPIKVEAGAAYDGGLINPIPISEPDRPLKRVENVSFDATYQPTGTPLLHSDVRAMNNILIVETTLQSDEYNGLGTTNSDYFTLTEVALAGGKLLGSVGDCDCDPHELFLEGSTDGDALAITFSGGDVITIDPGESASDVANIVAGDQIKIVDAGDTVGDTIAIDQVTPYYLVTAKSGSGYELTLDRVPTDSENTPLTGTAGIFRDTFRLYSHRILQTPIKKSSDFEITVRWSIIFS